MPAVEAGDAVVGSATECRNTVEAPAYQVPQRVTAEGVPAQKDHIGDENQGTQADAEGCTAGRVRKPHGNPSVIRQDPQENESDVDKVAMGVEQDQREVAFAEVFLARLADGTGRRLGPEGFVVSAAVVVTGKAEEARKRKDEQGRREPQPAGPPRGGHRSEPGIR